MHACPPPIADVLCKFSSIFLATLFQSHWAFLLRIKTKVAYNRILVNWGWGKGVTPKEGLVSRGRGQPYELLEILALG